LLSEDQAYGALAQALADHTDDLKRALKTVEDGLTYGQAHPITLQELERERLAWLEVHRTTSTQTHPQPLDIDPWEGTNTTRLRPYTGYRGYHPYRGYGREVPHG
jgi:hypothetical protein